MKLLKLLIVFVVLAGCQNPKKETSVDTAIDSVATDTVTPIATPEAVSNKRFRNVAVEKIDATHFRVTGEGQIFEASFQWSVEDGHNELASGTATTDMGAPEWGKFDFTITVVKDEMNTSMTLLLFEESAEDGSRQYVLPVGLEM